jgi:hypothetical protein
MMNWANQMLATKFARATPMIPRLTHFTLRNVPTLESTQANTALSHPGSYLAIWDWEWQDQGEVEGTAPDLPNRRSVAAVEA